jgi:HK97 family phage major capsid protein
MNIEEKRAQLEAEFADIARLVDEAFETKNFSGMDALTARTEQAEKAMAQLDGRYLHQKLYGGYDDGNGATPIAENQRIAFTKGMAQGLVQRKALASSGAIVVPQEFRPDPIALGKPATGLLDVLPVVPHASPQYAYLRQSTRTNNAAVVADLATKPTSVYSVSEITNALSVIAHLSEGIPRYWLNDNASLTGEVSPL